MVISMKLYKHKCNNFKVCKNYKETSVKHNTGKGFTCFECKKKYHRIKALEFARKRRSVV